MKNTLLSPHFAQHEFCESRTAEMYGIDNTPTPEVLLNLSILCKGTLEPLREALGMPVVITSGYRCKELNDMVSHRSPNSQHVKGQAADFYIGWNHPMGSRGPATDTSEAHRKRLIKAFCLILTNESIDFDQLILYPTFIHVSYVSPCQNRHSIMTAAANGRYKGVTREEAIKIV